MLACRKALDGVVGKPVSNAALVLSRCLQTTADQWVGAKALPAAARAASIKAGEIYKLAYDRWVADTKEHQSTVLTVQGRHAVGLGNESSTETGLTLHHTYGVPLIPGSSLKGICSHYCAEIWGKKDRVFLAKAPGHSALFGTTHDSGHIQFEDAWILPASLSTPKQGLLADVATPHHSAYYTG